VERNGDDVDNDSDNDNQPPALYGWALSCTGQHQPPSLRLSLVSITELSLQQDFLVSLLQLLGGPTATGRYWLPDPSRIHLASPQPTPLPALLVPCLVQLTGTDSNVCPYYLAGA
jgi:hypothetical protein